MTDRSSADDDRLARLAVADPTTAAHWAAAREGRLLLQRCTRCGHHQFYPRPFCLACESRELLWRDAGGYGEVYSMTVVRIPVTPGLVPPYVLALVDLDEGPRLLTNLIGDCAIGDRVRLGWVHRDGLPLPVFSPVSTDAPHPHSAVAATSAGFDNPTEGA